MTKPNTLNRFLKRYKLAGIGDEDLTLRSVEELREMVADAKGIKYYVLICEDQETAAITATYCFSSRSGAYHCKRGLEKYSSNTLSCTIETCDLLSDSGLQVVLDHKEALMRANDNAYDF